MHFQRKLHSGFFKYSCGAICLTELIVTEYYKHDVIIQNSYVEWKKKQLKKTMYKISITICSKISFETINKREMFLSSWKFS